VSETRLSLLGVVENQRDYCYEGDLRMRLLSQFALVILINVLVAGWESVFGVRA